MTPTPFHSSRPLEAWRSGLALWSTLAQAPSRVATAQTRMALRLMQAATPWPVARPAAAAVAEAPAAEAVAEAVPQAAPTEVSPPAVAPTPVEELPPEVVEVAPPEPVAVPAEPAPERHAQAVVLPPLAGAAEEPAFALAEAPVAVATKPSRPRGAPSGARARKPRRG